MEPDALADRLRASFPDAVSARGEVTVVVDREALLDALAYLRNDQDLSFRFLAHLAATDWPDRLPRFWLAYHLYSIDRGHRVRVSVGVPDDDPAVPTVTDLFPTADWFEREVFDFFGVRFEGHPDLRRIIMPDDWEGYPLRKDYSLGGVGTRYKNGAFIPPVDERGL